METIIGALFVISMLILAAAFIYFVVRGTSKAAETVEDTVEDARADAHQSEPDAIVTPPASGELMDEIPEGERIPEEESRETTVRE